MDEPHRDTTSHGTITQCHTDGNAVGSTGPPQGDHTNGDGCENPVDEMDGEEHECLPVPDEILEMILANLDDVDAVPAACVNRRSSALVCAYAARAGRVDVLEWLRANGWPWDGTTCSFAARRGRIDVIRWARSRGCPWDSDTCAAAAGAGHLATLKWARANGCPWDERVCTQAVSFGHSHVLKWAVENGCSFYRDTPTHRDPDPARARAREHPWG
ncbi:Ankyrin repeat protein [Pandoravirus kuranda]|uniref:Ankyrin repeat protein n=1 Tax=Pandoravirus kuranda TaxID=3019033 RepID=A0AA95EJ29_9VIRU|nr:Ankyrin repeat protein [Pandoravirus kuranda]